METAGLAVYLAKVFGPTLARILLATLLKGHVDFDAIEYGDIAETLADSLDIGGLINKVADGDRKAIRNASYIFDKIGDYALSHLNKLQHLDLRSTPINDVSILISVADLQELILTNTYVTSVSILREALPNLMIIS